MKKSKEKLPIIEAKEKHITWTPELQEDQRIQVVFEPKYERINFTGQRRVKMTWITFSEESHPMEIDLETIQDLLLKVYKKMNERIVIHDDLIDSFGLIKLIEIKEE